MDPSSLISIFLQLDYYFYYHLSSLSTEIFESKKLYIFYIIFIEYIAYFISSLYWFLVYKKKLPIN